MFLSADYIEDATKLALEELETREVISGGWRASQAGDEIDIETRGSVSSTENVVIRLVNSNSGEKLTLEFEHQLLGTTEENKKNLATEIAGRIEKALQNENVQSKAGGNVS
jgi:hypothetical protein